MYMYARTHFTSEGYEDVSLYSLFGVTLFYLSQRSTVLESIFVNNVRAKFPVCGGAFFCLSLFVLIPISYCLNDCNFVILLK